MGCFFHTFVKCEYEIEFTIRFNGVFFIYIYIFVVTYLKT